MTRRAVLLMPAVAAFDPLLEPMNRFAKAYNEFAEGMRSGIFDQRQAKRLSKLWREVESSGDWPR